MINPFDEDPGDLALSHMKRDVGPEKEKFSVAAMLGNEETGGGYFFVGEEGVKLGKIISKDIAEERG